MSLRNPFAPSLSSWCRSWASTPSSRRRSPLMCRLQSCETSWPLISMACQQVRPGSWAPVQSAYWRGLYKSYDSLWTWSASFGFYFEYQKCRVQVVFFTICPNNKVDKLKRLPNLWQQLESLIWKNKHLDQNPNKIQIPNINLQEDEGFLSSKWGYNLLMKCPIGTDGHITWSRSYTKRTEPNWDIRVKLKEPVVVVCHSFIPWRSTPQSTSKLVESSDSHHTLQPQLHLVTAACPGEIETVVRPTSHLLPRNAQVRRAAVWDHQFLSNQIFHLPSNRRANNHFEQRYDFRYDVISN